MAIDTAAKRLSALKFWQVYMFGTVPSGTVDRQSALWAYSGIAAQDNKYPSGVINAINVIGSGVLESAIIRPVEPLT